MAFIFRFSLSVILIFDNGKQFNNNSFMDFCVNLRIKQRFMFVEHLVKHLQSNDQAKLASKIILDGLKEQLDEAKGRWAKVLLSILWSYQTTPQIAMQEMSFKLAYRCEAMILMEVGQPFDRQVEHDAVTNKEQ